MCKLLHIFKEFKLAVCILKVIAVSSISAYKMMNDFFSFGVKIAWDLILFRVKTNWRNTSLKYKKPFSKFCYVALKMFGALNTDACVYLQLVSLFVTNGPFDDPVGLVWICLTS